MPGVPDIHYTRYIASVPMGKPGNARKGTDKTISPPSGRMRDVVHFGIPAVIGLLMIIWGTFLDSNDRLLAVVGLVLFLGFGWYAYRAFTRRSS